MEWNAETVRRKQKELLFPNITTYYEQALALESGRGMFLKDVEGREYLDFYGGILTVSVGHCHPRVTEAAIAQQKKLVHVSTLYATVPQLELAEKIDAMRADLKVQRAEAERRIKQDLKERWIVRDKINNGIDALHGAEIGAFEVLEQRVHKEMGLLYFSLEFSGRHAGELLELVDEVRLIAVTVCEGELRPRLHPSRTDVAHGGRIRIPTLAFDQRRADAWVRELAEGAKSGSLDF